MTLTLGVLAIVTNLATSAVPEGWWWLHDGRVLWSAVGVLLMLTVGLSVWAARASSSTGEPDGSANAGMASTTGTVPAVGTIHATSGAVVTVSSMTAPAVPVPPPAAPRVPGQVVVGQIPDEPMAMVERAAVTRIGELFDGGERVAVVCTLTGGPGVGKTQAAAAYARARIGDRCPLVAWVSGRAPDVLVADLERVAAAVGVADPDGDPATSAARLRDHLHAREDAALLVVDNATDPDDLRRWLPVAGRTRVIVTTTDRAGFASLGAPVNIEVYDRDQSVAYLNRRTRLGPTPHENQEQDRVADAVAEELEDLPLALAQAASVITLQRLTYRRYLDNLQAVPVAQMLPRSAGDPYPHGAAEAILLAVDAVCSDRDGIAARVLGVVSVLAPQGVERELLAHLVSNDAPAGTVDRLLARMVGSSLLGWDASGSTIIAHRLVSRTIRERAETTGTLTLMCVHALRMIEAAWEKSHLDKDKDPLAVAAVEHLAVLSAHMFDPSNLQAEQQETVKIIANLLNRTATYLTSTGNTATAARLSRHVSSMEDLYLRSNRPYDSDTL